MQYYDTFFQKRIPSTGNRNNCTRSQARSAFPSHSVTPQWLGPQRFQQQTTSRNRSFSMNPCLLFYLGHQPRFSLFKVFHFRDSVALCALGTLLAPFYCSDKAICLSFLLWVRVLVPLILKVLKFFLKIDWPPLECLCPSYQRQCKPRILEYGKTKTFFSHLTHIHSK